MAPDRRRIQTALLAGLLLAGGWTTWVLIEPVWSGGVAAPIHDSIIAGVADYPHQYRPLVPWLVELQPLPLPLAYLAQRLLFWWLALLVLRAFCERYLDADTTFVGLLLVAALLPFSVIGQGYQETDPFALLCFSLGFRLLEQRRDGWLFVVIAVGMTARETVGLLVLLAAAVRVDEWRRLEYWRLILGLAATAAMVWLALRLGYGPREAFTELVTPAVNIPENLSRAGSLRVVVLFGPVWALALWRLRGAPAFLRRSLVLVPVFLVVHLCYGLIGETRYFLPLAPCLVPLALRHLAERG